MPHLSRLFLRRLTAILFVVPWLAGCGQSWDDKAALDAQIEEGWLAERELVDAVEFFENGGLYEDSQEPEAKPIDEPTVLPLVRRLRDELGLEVKAVLEDPQYAFAIIVEVPDDPATQGKIREILREADEEFFGVIMHNWGHRWISLDFFDETEMKLLAETGVLEEIQAQNQ